MYLKKGTILLGCLLFFYNCARIEYRNQGTMPVQFSANPNHKNVFEIEQKKEFFLWGLVPTKQYVDVDSVFFENGFKEVSKINVKEYMSWTDKLVSTVTLGIFIPYHVKLSGLMLPKREE